MKSELKTKKQGRKQLIERMKEVQEQHLAGMKEIAMIPWFCVKWECKPETVKAVRKKVLDAIAAEIPQGVESKRVSLWMSAEKVYDAAFKASDFRACVESLKLMAALYSLMGGDMKVNGQIEVKGTATLGQMHEALLRLEGGQERRN